MTNVEKLPTQRKIKMKIAVLFASHRTGGKHEEIKKMLLSLPLKHTYDFIEMSSINVKPCLMCDNCTGGATCDKDNFPEALARLVNSDINIIVVPVYAPYPSKFVALMEKLLKVAYLNSNKPLNGKKTAIVYYCSTKICDETPIKVLWQQYLTDDYNFDFPTYNFINHEQNPNERYNYNVTEYVEDIVLNII